MKRLNITLPDDVAQELAHKKNKSCFIARALEEKFKKEKQEKIENLMKEGYKATSHQDKKINSEWEQADLEKWS